MESRSDRTDTDVHARLAAVEARLDALESALEAAPTQSTPTPGTTEPASPTRPGAPTGDADALWLLDELPRRGDFPDGSVIFAGDVSIGGRRAVYQWHRPTHVLVDEPWDDNLDRLAALAHPVRGAILRRLLCAPATVTELVDEHVVSSTGTAYHHLGALQAGGWVAKESGGRHSVRSARVVPLLTIIAASEDH
ncbi:ArsR/SmtB family transcription factor [Corynebacterium suedekumii]|uniref:Winged helix-turn-helix domain-containing protein n=1 Tax=Corynebacterium suedekumii TaxID=3049801 RepID=A0ABY8VJ18_9CORY|nr:winged helix-turn-helix domain-containing protein [Corynebacterium suedekumii]WIM69554.1 winged helix-turn-helix domain-containing protein [Corynebacterium suedekumii]